VQPRAAVDDLDGLLDGKLVEVDAIG